MFCTNFCIYIGLFYGKLDVQIGIFLIVLHSYTLILQGSFVQTALILKTLLIFNGELIAEYSENSLMWGYRVVMVMYSALFFGISKLFAKPTNPFMLYLMTGSREQM